MFSNKGRDDGEEIAGFLFGIVIVIMVIGLILAAFLFIGAIIGAFTALKNYIKAFSNNIGKAELVA